MPGLLIQALRRVQVRDPVLMIDEIDKMSGGGPSGDPTAAMLEVLDPSQNNSFVDHYLNLPFDLSSCLFICTANNLFDIPAPLRDRMEIIKIAGYTVEELSLIHISEPTRLLSISYAVFCLKKKKTKTKYRTSL